MMPGEDGLSLCRHLRATTEVPVIMLTAMAEDTDRVIGLEMGADDYVVKPFNPRELLARIKAVLRRANSLPQQRAQRRRRADPLRPLAARTSRGASWSARTAWRSRLSTAEFLLLSRAARAIRAWC